MAVITHYFTQCDSFRSSPRQIHCHWQKYGPGTCSRFWAMVCGTTRAMRSLR